MTKKTRRAKARRALLTLSLVLVVAFAAVGGTVAWLTDVSNVATNTFMPTKIDVWLEEDTGKDNNYQFDIIPGGKISKDPKVSLGADSEACYVFVKIEEKGNYSTYFGTDSYTVDSYWTPLTGFSGVYYKELTETEAKAGFIDQPVIKDNTITVPDALTQTEMQTIASATEKPMLVFTAYAIQKEGTGTAAEAWEKVKSTTDQFYVQPDPTPAPTPAA